MLQRDDSGGRNQVRTARGFRMACLALGLALVAVGCAGRDGDDGGDGVRGGTLRVLSEDVIDGLDTAITYTPSELAIARTYARTLYGHNLSAPPDQVTTPVADIANGPPQLSADRRTYTFTLRPGVRYAPPVNREVAARDFITAIQRFYDQSIPPRLAPSAGQQYANLIVGAAEFGSGKAERISGLAAPDARTLKITLVRPAGDLLSILTLALFAPVPGEFAATYAVGDNYVGHVVGSGPYTPTTYDPGRLIVLVRNPKWDPATDPLRRRAWVDRIQVKHGVKHLFDPARDRPAAGRPVARPATCPRRRSPRSRPTPSWPGDCRSTHRPACWFLTLGTNPKAGAIADVRVRQAVNYAIDKVAYRDAIAGGYAPAGELASTILAPGSLGYRPSNLYPTPGGRGDPAKAKALLAEAGYPNGLTLGFATFGSGRQAAATKPIRESLARAGIDLKVKTYKGNEALVQVASDTSQAPGAPAWVQRLVPRLPRGQRQGDDRAAVRRAPPQPQRRRQHQRVRQPGREPPDRPRAGRARPGPPGGPVERDRPTDHERRPPSPACSGRTRRTSGPPGSMAGCTTPGRPRPTSPPRGWTLRRPDRGATSCPSRP